MLLCVKYFEEKLLQILDFGWLNLSPHVTKYPGLA